MTQAEDGEKDIDGRPDSTLAGDIIGTGLRSASGGSKLESFADAESRDYGG